MYFLHAMDCFLCEKVADQNTLLGGAGVQWRLIGLKFAPDLIHFVLKL